MPLGGASNGTSDERGAYSTRRDGLLDKEGRVYSYGRGASAWLQEVPPARLQEGIDVEFEPPPYRGP